MEKIRVLHILYELHPSGAEMMLYNAYPYWKSDCACTIMGTGKKIGPFAEQMKERGYEIAYVPTVGEGKRAKLAHLKSFWRYMKQHSYDVINIHRESLSFEYALLARLSGCKRICRTVHSNFRHQGIQRKIKSATRWMMRQFLHVTFIAISDGVAENEKQIFGNDCQEKIYNWCNNKKYEFVDGDTKKRLQEERNLSDKLVIVSVGNCNRVKNHTTLLRAVAEMEHNEKIHFYHVGYSDETEQEEALARELKIADAVEFLGSTNPIPYLKSADLFVMSSLYEGLSIAALEALFTGIPMLLARAPGLVEFEDKGFSNVTYYDSDAKMLAEALDDYVKRKEAGMLAPDIAQCKRAEEFYDCEKQVQKYVKVYQSMMGKGKNG